MKADWSVPCGGTSAPRFEEIATRFGVTIFTEHVGRPSLDETDQTIADASAGGEGLMTSQIVRTENSGAWYETTPWGPTERVLHPENF